MKDRKCQKNNIIMIIIIIMIIDDKCILFVWDKKKMH